MSRKRNQLWRWRRYQGVAKRGMSSGPAWWNRPWAYLRLMCWLFLWPMLLPGTAVAGPLSLATRQTWSGTWAHDFTTYGCRPIIFIYARETIAPGNMGFWVGPHLSNGLKTYFGATNVASEGVDYLGRIDTNFFLGGAPPVGIGLMQILLTRAATLCPTAKIVAAGYSQGAAVTHRAIQGLGSAIKDRIVAVVTFGDTQTLQDRGIIPGFPPAKTLIICNIGDVVCTGTLYVFPIHFDYTRRVPEALYFLITRLLTSWLTTPVVIPGLPQATQIPPVATLPEGATVRPKPSTTKTDLPTVVSQPTRSIANNTQTSLSSPILATPASGAVLASNLTGTDLLGLVQPPSAPTTLPSSIFPVTPTSGPTTAAAAWAPGSYTAGYARTVS